MFYQLCGLLPTCIANICIDYVSDERILKKQFHRGFLIYTQIDSKICDLSTKINNLERERDELSRRRDEMKQKACGPLEEFYKKRLLRGIRYIEFNLLTSNEKRGLYDEMNDAYIILHNASQEKINTAKKKLLKQMLFFKKLLKIIDNDIKTTRESIEESPINIDKIIHDTEYAVLKTRRILEDVKFLYGRLEAWSKSRVKK